jgi:hypothetical protein
MIIRPINLQWFNPETGEWEEKEIPAIDNVIREIERIEALGAISFDYRQALITIVNQVTQQSLNGIEIEAN